GAGRPWDEKDERGDGIERLFRRYGKGVGSYVYARLGDADLAESITSAVFLVVVRRFEQCRSSPAGWIWSVVRSELARHFRDRRPAEPLDAAGSVADAAAPPFEAAARRETQARMRAALERLTEE